MKKHLIEAIVHSVFAILILTGCLGLPQVSYVKLAYQAYPNEKSPLSTLKPMTFIVLVEDQRVPKDLERVVGKTHPPQWECCNMYSRRDLTEVITEALKNALENNGHAAVPTNGPTNVAADVTIRVNLKKYWIQIWLPDFHFDYELTATLDAEVGLVDYQQVPMLAPKLIAGTYQESRYILRNQAYESVLNGALEEFIANLSRDPSVLAALKSVELKQ